MTKNTPTVVPKQYAPVEHWGPDILGPGFFARTLPLGTDEEGQLLATLIKHDPQADPEHIRPNPVERSFTLLYVHGWNDYYFQRELARHVSAGGGAFYAMDLEKFGRSLRPGQTFGKVSDLSDYDRDFTAALAVIKKEHPGLPMLIMGHSMGGLITTLWTSRHPGEVQGLLLNSPWLSHFSDSLTSFAARICRAAHGHLPKRIVDAAIPANESDSYELCLGRWKEEEIPANLNCWKDDPAIAGWGLVSAWKNPRGRGLRYGWISAIIRAHNQIASGSRVDIPVLLTLSTSSSTSSSWNPLMHFQDVVLDVDAILRHGSKLSQSVTIERFHGVHDLALSVPPVRSQYWQRIHSWLRQQGFESEETYAALAQMRGAICP